jgi:hypothetical protein
MRPRGNVDDAAIGTRGSRPELDDCAPNGGSNNFRSRFSGDQNRDMTAPKEGLLVGGAGLHL